MEGFATRWGTAPNRRQRKTVAAAAIALLAVLALGAPGRADEPFARSRDYDLQHSTIRLCFDTDQRKIFGDVTHRLSILREAASRIVFDSVALRIESVTLDGQTAQFEVAPAQLVVQLPAPARRGDSHTIEIRYQGSPRQGLFFILPDKNYPSRPVEIWTQGEAEDTRHYLPTYDYPNDRLTTDTYLTVPPTWETISNGRLESKTPDAKGQVVWHWVQDAPISTYLISIVAGEFDRVDDTWRSIPLTFYTPRGERGRIHATFEHTRAMLDFFVGTFGVPYPWSKYSQVTVDEFTEDGMENTSATTLSTRALLHPATVAEQPLREDDLISHELAHQWFGDLVTCKDWTNLWLNEGFATAMEYFWEEHEYGRDDAAYTRWNDAREWLGNERMFPVPILNSKFNDSLEYADNVYTKAGLVLYMLREQLGPADFYAGLKHYLEKYRGQNVVTADLVSAIEEATARNVDQFFQQWIYGAGAPSLAIRYTYEDARHEVQLEVKQTQKIEGAVGLFTLPTTVEIVTASGSKRFPVLIAKAAESFALPVDGPPLLVLFDPGDTILDTVQFDKSTNEWIYQLRHAESVPDRADAAVVLGGISGQDSVVSALAEAAHLDPFWGVRYQTLEALAKLGGLRSRDVLLAALDDSDPRVAASAATLFGAFPQDSQVAARLEAVFRSGRFYRQREAALVALGRLRSPNAYDVLLEAARTESPDDGLRRAAFRGLGELADVRAIPLVLAWASPGRPLHARAAAIRALGSLDAHNKNTTARLLSYLDERILEVRRATLTTLDERADASAIAPLEAVLTRGELSGSVEELARRVVVHLRKAKDESAVPANSPASPH
ncbi:MAG TPA: M1 family aminopeptidase [Candidatus Acidoferrales bacterium]|nr:M1 family aminopeptidase [Candidatus Acidoferrales bacterium]